MTNQKRRHITIASISLIGFIWVLLSVYSWSSLPTPEETSADTLWLLDVKGAIGPAKADYVVLHRPMEDMHI